MRPVTSRTVKILGKLPKRKPPLCQQGLLVTELEVGDGSRFPEDKTGVAKNCLNSVKTIAPVSSHSLIL